MFEKGKIDFSVMLDSVYEATEKMLKKAHFGKYPDGLFEVVFLRCLIMMFGEEYVKYYDGLFDKFIKTYKKEK